MGHSDRNCKGHLLTSMNSVYFDSAKIMFAMESQDKNFNFKQWMIKFVIILLTLCGTTGAKHLFQPNKEYVYSYNSVSNSGVLLPSGAASSWGLHGKLIIQTTENSIYMQLKSLKMSMANGEIENKNVKVDVDSIEMLKPFHLTYKNGLAENFSITHESVWSTNMKRSIAGILQLDLMNLDNVAAFYSIEVNHYGQCNVEYVGSAVNANEKIIRKFIDPHTCVGHPRYDWTNVPNMQCNNNDQNPVLKSSERLYKVRSSGSLYEIVLVNATGEIYVQPFQSQGEAHFLFTRQSLELESVTDIINKISTNDMHMTALQHELPQDDLTQGRNVPNKEFIFKSIGGLLDRLSQRLENPGLDTETNNLHNTTISVLLYYFSMLDRTDLQLAYNKISGTSYKEETIRNMFLEALPQVGTKEATLFVLDLIQNKKVSDITAIQLLTHLPFHVRRPDVQLLVNLQPFLNFPGKISMEVQNTAILTYGTLIYKTCLLYCPYEMLDDYVRLYLDKFTASTQYEQKMVWLQGLANIQLGRVVEFLEPIASGSNAESRHFRALAAWASVPTAPLRPDVIYPVYWPILINQTEYLEMRIAALTLLIVSNPTPSRLISLYWYLQNEPNQHLYNYFYTTLKSMEHTTYPCYAHIGGLAAQFVRILRKPNEIQQITTGNYLFDYQDSHRKFGAMLHSVVIANPLTNIPEVFYITFNNYGSGRNLNNVALYIKGEGLLNALSTYVETPTQVKDILSQFKVNYKEKATAHLEIIARVQGKTVLCLHLNETNIEKAVQYLTTLPDNVHHIYQNMEFHINQQRINVPLIMESIQVTDLGTNVRLAVMATSLFSMRGNFTRTSNGRNNHVILRTSVHGTEMIEHYNPIIDLWHGAERAQSIHGYLPINVTIGLEERPFISYNTPTEYLKTGITAHTRTVTNIRGAKVKSKLLQICPHCLETHVVTKAPSDKLQTTDIFNFQFLELGGHFRAKVFDCDNKITQQEILTNVFSSHRSNHRIWPLMRFPLMGLHLLDYFTYVPPKGSCGIAAYIESMNFRRSQVKLEYAKNNNYHMMSLTHRDMDLSKILQQWTVAMLYEPTSWISDSLKLKATRVAPNEKVLKFCLEAEKEIPWQWDFLNTNPSGPSRVKLNMMWGLSETAKGKCTGSSVLLELVGEVMPQQVDNSKTSKWPYGTCQEESTGKRTMPFTEACYEASKELSTLRKYQISVQYKDLPKELANLAWKLRAFYNLVGGSNYSNMTSDSFLVGVTIPKDSNTGILQIDSHKLPIQYDYNLIDFLLTRTRIHKYMDNRIIHAFFSFCVLTPNTVRTVYNTTVHIDTMQENLLLGHCDYNNPRIAVAAKYDNNGFVINSYDESGYLKIVPFEKGGAVFNSTTRIPMEPDFVFSTVDNKRVRLDDKSVDILFPNMLMYVHWTQDQVFLFFPNHFLEFSCGICMTDNNTYNLYEKL